ncbi:Metallo-dependent phosphatase-like protein [Sporodiniella umbellata]|nr:Metallo-dependent phosphatase-like protein [Sporodiniella umbellata]
MKEKAKKLRKDLFVVDTGDTHDGDGLSDVTNPKGKETLPLIANIPYDLLTIGNHELYVANITTDTVKNFVPHWKDRYLAANVYLKDVNSNKTVQLGNKYTYFQGKFGTRVLAYGFLFNFKGNANNSVVNLVADEIAKPWFNESLKAHTPDVVTLIGHIGIRFEEFKTIIKAVRAYYPTIPIAVLGGHTHIRDFVVYDNRAAGIESGRFLETIGFFSLEGIHKPSGNITFNRRYLDQNRATYIYHSVDNKEKKFDTSRGKRMSKKIYKLREQLQISQTLGCSPANYTLDFAPATSNTSIYHLTTNQVLPAILGDKSSKNPALYLYNTGGLRYDIFQGPFTVSNTYQVAPFDNRFYRIHNVPVSVGQKILPTMNRQGELKKRELPPQPKETSVQTNTTIHLTPGYVTHDDYGTGGDDTLHSALPFFRHAAFVGSELPQDLGNDTLIDVVYLDFFDAQLRKVLKTLTGTEWTANKTVSPFSGNTVWVEFAKKHWEKC